MTQYPLTPKQARVKAFIIDYMARNDGVSPSYAEIMDGCGFKSRNSVHFLVKRLIQRGHARAIPGAARSIAIVEAKE